MKKILAMTLAVLMLISILPMSVLAAVGSIPDDMTIVEDDKSTLAPGITQRKMVVYDKNNNRVEMFVAVADTSVDTVGIYANYMDNQNKVYGMQKTTDQAAAFEANHPDHNVVVAINASYFNTNNGKPTGVFVMEGSDVTTEAEGNNYPFFAILNDGTPIIAAKGEYSSYKGQIAEAIGGWIHLVKDGAICSGLNTVDKYPRQTIGLTADGQVILMTADNLAPKSNGLTIQEQAEVMLAMGCVEALHLDGGGSATYCSKAEGSDELKVVNSPSNGSERTVSNTLIFTSTAVADGTFDHAILNAEADYATPGLSVAISAKGVDAAGGAAEVPTEGISWQLKDASMGTVADGVFTSNGTVGTAIVQMIYDGKVVGETDVKVVIPDGISFGREQIVVPFGETVNVALDVTYGVNSVKFSDSDITASLENAAAGKLNGLQLTAPAADSGITGTNLTVALRGTELTATVAVKYGKGSEVVFDFEEGSADADVDNWIVRTHESKIDDNEQGEVYVVNKETGMVHDGEQALAFHADFSQATGSPAKTDGYIALSISWTGDPVSIKGAQKVGFWLYMPEDATTTEIIVNGVYYSANGTANRRSPEGMDDNGEYIRTPYWSTHMEESGWQYIVADFSSFTDDLYIKDEPALSQAFKRNFFIKIYCVFGPIAEPFADNHGDFTYYIDNVTVDYSDAVADRERPIFGDSYAYGAFSDKTLAYGKTIDVTENELIFSAAVADNTAKDNYTGISATSAKVYVDGVAVNAVYNGGTITSDSVKLLDGYHRVKFEVADNNGNIKTIIREINVNTEADNTTVKLVPRDASLDRLLSGSVYWVDVVADDLTDIKSVEALFNLNSINNWELEHMVVADGFTATYSSTAAQDAEKNVLIKFQRNGAAVDADSNVIASIPVRIWDSRVHTYAGLSGKTPAYLWTNQCINHRQLRVRVDKGVVTYTDGTTSTFSDKIVVDHEAYTDYALMDATYFASKTSYHVHSAVALDDKAATCTEAGYTGRTYCEVCDSVVDWGTTLAAKGHTFKVVDGALKCDTCGEANALNGLYEAEEGVYYLINGQVQSGWQYVGTDWYYFDETTKLGADGELTLSNVTYEFEQGRMTAGVWTRTLYGTRYYDGPKPVYNGWITVDGKDYCFDNYYRVEGGYQAVLENHTNPNIYFFEEDGSCDRSKVIPDGFYTDRNGLVYVKDGDVLTGLQTIDGSKYYFNFNGYAFKGQYAGYLFGDDYKAVSGLIEVDGETRYYVDGKPKMAGLVEVDGDLYFAYGSKGQIATGTTYVWEGNGILPEATYTFGADGKLLQGVVKVDGVYKYYVNGQPKMAGLVEVDGDYYFAYGKQGEVAIGTTYVWEGNGILPEATYKFGPDGKLLQGVVNDDGVLRYYENGKYKMAGLINIDGDYYFAYGKQGEVAIGTTYVWEGNGLLPEATYKFGTDGKMLQGVVLDDDGALRYYVNGQYKMDGLINIDGDYYFAYGKKGEVAIGTTYVWEGNGLLPEATYKFGSDGKMLQGIVEEDGVLRYYVNGQYKMAGLICIDGDYYFANGKMGEVAIGTTYVWEGNGLLPEATYKFGSDGKMLQGVVKDDDGVLRYYENGRYKMAGLIEIDGDYYFAGGSKGEVATGTTYVWEGNGLLPEATYKFGADGKMLDGFVTTDDGIFYYEQGKNGTVGINYIDGNYYFIDYGAKVITNCSFYVWEGNGYTINATYKFDELGRVVL